MSYDGNGTYDLPSPEYPAVAGTTILADDFNTVVEDIAAALSLAFVRDGQAAMTGDLDLGGHALENGSIASGVTGVTQTTGTNNTTLATCAFVVQQAFAAALPANPNDGFEHVTREYNNTVSWSRIKTVDGASLLGAGNIVTGVGTVTSTSGSANITLTSSSSGYQAVTMTAMGKHVSLPDATGLTVGGPRFIVRNEGGYPFGIRDNSGTLLAAVAAGGIIYITLKDNSTAAGSWSFTGTGVENGLVTVDSTFSSSYSANVLKPFVALDSDKSIHFIQNTSSDLYAVAVDNVTKAVGTPVLVATATANLKAAFKVSSTTAIVFYTDAANSDAVVISLSGATTLTVGTPQNSAGTEPWGSEDSSGAPRIAQLTSTLYLTSYTTGANTTVRAVSVSGTTVTIGSAANIITANSVSNSTTTYALTAATGLVIYANDAAAPWTLNAVVISVSGTTCTVGTPAQVADVISTGTPPIASCLLSATKALVLVDNNTTTARAYAATISGTTVTWGAACDVETSVAGFAASNLAGYTASGATRYNPHLFPLTSSTALLWYLDSSAVSRAVVLSESGGTVTAGTKFFRSISLNGSGSSQYGVVLPQGTSSFLALNQLGASSAWKKLLIPHKISGTTITGGEGCWTPELNPTSNAAQHPAALLTSGDLIITGVNQASLKIVRTNGDFVRDRGGVAIPNMSGPTAHPLQAVSSNRIVLIGGTVGASIDAGTEQCRLITVEIAA